MATILFPHLCYIHTNGAGILLSQLWKIHTLAERAIEEPEFLFDVQWKNGMLPQKVYANEKNKKEEDTFFPSAEFCDATRSPNAPRQVKI
jgi:hypothetical protein